ncbi:MAG: hypothetical protein WAL47_17770 [Pyrinomonadaceae bacterium]
MLAEGLYGQHNCFIFTGGNGMSNGITHGIKSGANVGPLVLTT